MLYVVSTPIGNKDDITLRALEILKGINIIICEDTRRIKNLLKLHSIDYQNKRFIVNNEYNERKKLKQIISLLKEKDVCLVSDAGTPLISDPGFLIVRECIRESIDITSVPGPVAFVNALVLSGFPTQPFVFYGFLPKGKNKKTEFFKNLDDDKTIVFYESPYRIIKTLEIMKELIPKRLVCVCRELTKKFEQFIRGYPEELLSKIHKNPKGEFVVVIAPKDFII